MIESKHINNVAKLKEFVDQAKVYVRPLQKRIIMISLVEKIGEPGDKAK